METASQIFSPERLERDPEAVVALGNFEGLTEEEIEQVLEAKFKDLSALFTEVGAGSAEEFRKMVEMARQEHRLMGVKMESAGN